MQLVMPEADWRPTSWTAACLELRIAPEEDLGLLQAGDTARPLVKGFGGDRDGVPIRDDGGPWLLLDALCRSGTHANFGGLDSRGGEPADHGLLDSEFSRAYFQGFTDYR